jgi:hypothetical protein
MSNDYCFVQNKLNLEIIPFQNAEEMKVWCENNNKNLYWFGYKIWNIQKKFTLYGEYGEKHGYKTFHRSLWQILETFCYTGCTIGWVNCCHFLKIEPVLKCGMKKKIRQNSKKIRAFMRRNHLEKFECFYTSDNQPPNHEEVIIYDTYDLLKKNHPNWGILTRPRVHDHQDLMGLFPHPLKYYVLNKLHHLSIHEN